MTSAVPTRIGLSASARASCVVRYLGVSLAAAAAGAVILWALGKTAWAGAAGGLVLGLLGARFMLRPLSWPRLVLSRDALYLVRRNRKALVIPWDALQAIRPGGALVTLEFSQEVEAPGEGMISGLGLEAARFGMPAEVLALALEGARERRAELPDDAAVRTGLAG